MADKRKKRPRDPNQLAKLIVDIATGGVEDVDTNQKAKDPNAVALGSKGGKKGGVARANSLTAEQRQEIARKAAKARWASED